MAKRIQARAILRLGQLINQIEKATKHNAKKQRDSTGPLLSRTQAAADAGISKRQAGVLLKEMKANGQRASAEKGRPKEASNDITLKSQPSSMPLFKCKKCSETFSEPVWHCSKCAHHWQIQRHERDGHNLECRNCHETSMPKWGLWENQNHSANVTPTLSDLGITRDQSSKWQALAEVPEEQFEQALKDPTRGRPSASDRIAIAPQR
jgi:hypothetical protein